MAHVSTLPKQTRLYGGLRQADRRGVLVDGDLTSKADAKAAITVDTNKMHVSERHRLEAQSHAAVDNAEEFLTDYTTAETVGGYSTLPTEVKHEGGQLVY